MIVASKTFLPDCANLQLAPNCAHLPYCKSLMGCKLNAGRVRPLGHFTTRDVDGVERSVPEPMNSLVPGSPSADKHNDVGLTASLHPATQKEDNSRYYIEDKDYSILRNILGRGFSLVVRAECWHADDPRV
jgi:hypothetical protein